MRSCQAFQASRSGARAVSGRVLFDPNRNGRCAWLGVAPELARGRLAAMTTGRVSGTASAGTCCGGSELRLRVFAVRERGSELWRDRPAGFGASAPGLVVRLQRGAASAGSRGGVWNLGFGLRRSRTTERTLLRDRACALGASAAGSSGREQGGVASAGPRSQARSFGFGPVGVGTRGRCFCGTARAGSELRLRTGGSGNKEAASTGLRSRGSELRLWTLWERKQRSAASAGLRSQGSELRLWTLWERKQRSAASARTRSQAWSFGFGSVGARNVRSGFPAKTSSHSTELRFRSLRSGDDGGHPPRACLAT
jgi:hypothetical protein